MTRAASSVVHSITNYVIMEPTVGAETGQPGLRTSGNPPLYPGTPCPTLP